MTALTGGAPYMVVDLSGGVDALSYPVSYLSSVPAGGWTDEYKTTKLVLRLIPPGTFMMGSPSDELGRYSNETLHQVTLTKPFYIGVFELTQKQWQLVMGDTPSYYKGDTRPVEQVSYNTIRGSVNGAAWPTHNQVDANSFMGRLRSKVNMLFDLPTEAQWEYACRAGTSTALNSGKNLTGTQNCANMAEVGRYIGNTGDGKGGYSQHTKVGSYLGNAWGLYDMHGNVHEWCIDWYVDNLGKSHVLDPSGASSGTYRLWKGGCFNYENGGYARACRSARRIYSYYYPNGNWDEAYPSRTSIRGGFRVVCLPAE
jgi:formylglycine-generating enzyme required for sulfatase activity